MSARQFDRISLVSALVACLGFVTSIRTSNNTAAIPVDWIYPGPYELPSDAANTIVIEGVRYGAMADLEWISSNLGCQSGICSVGEECQEQLAKIEVALSDHCRKAVNDSHTCWGDLKRIVGFFSNSVDSEFRGYRENLEGVTNFLDSSSLPEWFLNLANSLGGATVPVLWAGFWDSPDQLNQRDSMTAMQRFAEQVDGFVVHPFTELGQIVASASDLRNCTWRFSSVFWTYASRALVETAAAQRIGTLTILVNKELTHATRPLRASVLYQTELFVLMRALKRNPDWRPQLIIIDLKGTCSQIVPIFMARLGGTGKKGLPQVSAMTCVNCVDDNGCSLSNDLADFIRERTRK